MNAVGSPRQGLLGSPHAQPCEYQGILQRKTESFCVTFGYGKTTDVQCGMGFTKEVASLVFNVSYRCQNGAEGCHEKMLVGSGRRAAVLVSAHDQMLVSPTSAVLLFCVGITSNYLSLLLLWQH